MLTVQESFTEHSKTSVQLLIKVRRYLEVLNANTFLIMAISWDQIPKHTAHFQTTSRGRCLIDASIVLAIILGEHDVYNTRRQEWTSPRNFLYVTFLSAGRITYTYPVFHEVLYASQVPDPPCQVLRCSCGRPFRKRGSERKSVTAYLLAPLHMTSKCDTIPAATRWRHLSLNGHWSESYLRLYFAVQRIF